MKYQSNQVKILSIDEAAAFLIGLEFTFCNFSSTGELESMPLQSPLSISKNTNLLIGLTNLPEQVF